MVAGPGAGKSTLSHYMIYLLKQAGFDVEHIPEEVKPFAYKGQTPSVIDQCRFMVNQIDREMSFLNSGKPMVLVCESPVTLNPMYTFKMLTSKFSHIELLENTDVYYSADAVKDGMREIIKHYFEQMTPDVVNMFVKIDRGNKPYKNSGRYQTKEESANMDAYLGASISSFIVHDRDKVFDICYDDHQTSMVEIVDWVKANVMT